MISSTAPRETKLSVIVRDDLTNLTSNLIDEPVIFNIDHPSHITVVGMKIQLTLQIRERNIIIVVVIVDYNLLRIQFN